MDGTEPGAVATGCYAQSIESILTKSPSCKILFILSGILGRITVSTSRQDLQNLQDNTKAEPENLPPPRFRYELKDAMDLRIFIECRLNQLKAFLQNLHLVNSVHPVWNSWTDYPKHNVDRIYQIYKILQRPNLKTLPPPRFRYELKDAMDLRISLNAGIRSLPLPVPYWSRVNQQLFFRFAN